MTNIFDALEICLREIEGGAEMESALAQFPEHAAELRPLLKTAARARSMTPAGPAPEAALKSRARVLQYAAEMRGSKHIPRRRMIPAFQRLAISFALAALSLVSGVGLVNASASALPGEGLYPVKRGWENIRLFFIFDSQAREMLKDEFENERLQEVNELLAEGRHEVIQFAGVFMQVNGVSYVSGLRVILPEGMQSPANGDAVIVSGRTNAQGYVEVIRLELLPDGSIVPVGNPIEMESESDSADDSAPSGEPGSGSGNEAENVEPAVYEINGTLQAVSATSLTVSGMSIALDNSKIKGELCVGAEVEVKGYYTGDGKFVATEVKGGDGCEGGGSPNSNGGSNTNDDGLNDNSGSDDHSGADDNQDSDDNANDDDSGGDDSGGHGGGDDD